MIAKCLSGLAGTFIPAHLSVTAAAQSAAPWTCPADLLVTDTGPDVCRLP